MRQDQQRHLNDRSSLALLQFCDPRFQLRDALLLFPKHGDEHQSYVGTVLLPAKVESLLQFMITELLACVRWR
jgi:hypothetical protein